MSWVWKRRTFLNVVVQTVSSSSSIQKWSCKAKCTFLNPYDSTNRNEVSNTRTLVSDKPATLCEHCGSGKGRNKLKILTYNVWTNEWIETNKRMEAVGDLIKLHSPDVICFQEVISCTYRTSRESSWWREYNHCSTSSLIGPEKSFSCVLLSKLPVKSFSNWSLGNSKTFMERELCVAEIEVPNSKPLIVATSHLDSHIGARHTSGRESKRMKQSKVALNILDKNLNVVFGGDMNWDDELDGRFPLLAGWSDAWLELRPGEDGYTYDTESNLMLCANMHTLQKRLDRFICKLHDYKMCDIAMIGMDAIPGLSYRKQKYVKKEYKWCNRSELPVLPSDHYGLLLTICSQ